MRRLLRILVAGSISWAVPAHGAELRIGLAADVTSMDPHFLGIAPNINMAWHVFDALTHVDEDARLIPGLALSWRAVDATTWEFRLRRGVRFHDGTELTAEDVLFSIERTFQVPNGQFRTFTQRVLVKSAERVVLHGTRADSVGADLRVRPGEGNHAGLPLRRNKTGCPARHKSRVNRFTLP